MNHKNMIYMGLTAALLALPAFGLHAEMQKTVNDTLMYSDKNIPVIEDFQSQKKLLESQKDMAMIRNFAECLQFKDSDDEHELIVFRKEGVVVNLKTHYTVAQYRALVDKYAKKFGTPHVFADDRDQFIKHTYSYWQFKTGILAIRHEYGFDMEHKIGKELYKTNPTDPRVRFDQLNDAYFLTSAGIDEFKDKIHGGATIFYLTPFGIDSLKILPKTPIELGQAEAYFKSLKPVQTVVTLDPNRKAVGKVPAKAEKNAIFDVANQKNACFYKGQKFYEDAACTKMLYNHTGSKVSDQAVIEYGKEMFRFSGGRMYKNSSYDNKDVVATIAEVRVKRGDVQEAKLYKGCVFVRDREQERNDKGETIYTFKVSYDNVKPAVIPVMFTYKDGKLYRGDSTEERDCVLVFDPTLNDTRILFIAMTYAKQFIPADPAPAAQPAPAPAAKPAQAPAAQPAPAPAAKPAPAPAAQPAPAPAEKKSDTGDAVKSGLKSLKSLF